MGLSDGASQRGELGARVQKPEGRKNQVGGMAQVKAQGQVWSHSVLGRGAGPCSGVRRALGRRPPWLPGGLSMRVQHACVLAQLWVV